MSRFTDLFQEQPAPTPEPTSEPEKVEEVVAKKTYLSSKTSKKRMSLD